MPSIGGKNTTLNPGDPIFDGTSGPDSFGAPSGNSGINGFGGTDTVTFSFNLVDAVISYAGPVVIIDTATSHTELTGIETYHFADGTVSEDDDTPLVADLYYYGTYHDVWNAGADADLHYNGSGWHEHRNPNPFFNTDFYLSLYQDVNTAGINPLTHYGTTGWTVGRIPSPLFDPAKYLAAYPDVAAAHIDPLLHFLTSGVEEGRVPSPVTSITSPNGFDALYYLTHYPDVAAAHADPFLHFMTSGWHEGRNPNAYFDTRGYLATYVDVAMAGVNPLDHFHNSGWKEGRNPSPGFDSQQYLAVYADVAAAGVDPLAHFLTYGINEGRVAFPEPIFDTNVAADIVLEGAAAGTGAGITASWGGWISPALSFSISGDSSGGGFGVDATTGQIVVADSTRLDFETSGASHSYVVTVVAHDGELSHLQTFTIGIGDVIPTTPVDSDAAANTVAEGAAAGSGVGVTLFSEDPNGPPVTYSLTNDAGGRFAINGSTGVVTVANPALLDFESSGPSHQFTITAQTTSGAAVTATQDFTITVTDVAPSSPVDANGAADSVAENAANGTLVGIVASSTDLNGPAPTYSLTDDAGGRFTVNGASGAVSVANGAAIDFETAPGHAYSITVRATVGALNSSQSFAIGVTDVNDNAPVFSSGPTASFAENTATSTVAYDANATDADGTSANNTIAYSLSAGGDNDLFDINATTGEVTFKVSPNFEAPGDAGANNVYDIVVHANDGVTDVTRNVAITVTDLNDNAPAFSSGTTANFAENTAAATVAYDANATDADGTSANNTIAYSLSAGGDNDLFNINASTGEVTFKVSPNFEAPADAGANNVYDIVVHANDGVNDTPRLVAITVTDVNDNAPVFSSGTTASFAENTATSTVAYDANATDADGTPANNTITYSLSAGGDNDFFNINPTTGEVTFKVSPNFEAPTDGGGNNVYDIVVTASDGTNSAIRNVAITVTDLNDNAPVFTSGTSGSEAENTAISNVVYDANATDADGTAANNTITFSLFAGGDNDFFNINPTTGAVTFKVSPNHEAPSDAGGDNTYDIVVHANDTTNDTTRNVAISVTELNDTAPVFTSSATPSVAENTTAVVTLAATDADTVGTFPPTFSITGGADGGLFTITGGNQLSFIAARDFETQTHVYVVQVTANDGANQTIQNLTITLTDVNDNAPVFTSTSTSSVAENTTAVVSLATTDADTVGTNPPNFSITGGADQGLFTITGGNQLAFIGARDFETQAHSYAVQVTANDGTNNTIQNITVTLTDVNDSAPVFTSSATPSVAENTTAVVSLATNDADTVGTNPPTFSITGGADFGLFTITGGNQLAFIAARDYDTQAHSYAVQVTANDGTNNTIQNITVTLTDTNDNSPIFQSGATGSEFENSPISTVAYDANATDADLTPAFNTITYSLSAGGDNDFFNINASTGEVTFKVSPNFEAPGDAGGDNGYDIGVHANDTLHDVTQNVTITVNDNNDPPTLSATGTNPIYAPAVDLFSSVSASTIESGQFIDQLVFTVSNVNDTDETMMIDGSSVALTNGTVVTPTFGNGMDVSVSVDGSNVATVTISKVGGITAAAMVGIVDGMTYTDATPPASGSRTVTITSVHDTGGIANGGNDTTTPALSSTVTFNQPPVIDAPANADTFATSIQENTTAVTTVHATDPDNQPVTPVTYSIVAGFEDALKFSIGSTSGVLTFTSAPDFDNPTDTATDGSNTYIVKVQASDGGTVDEQVITATVTNVNETPTANPDTADVTEAGGVANGTAGVNITSGFNVITGTGTGSVADTDQDAGTTLTVNAVNGSLANVNVGINNPNNYGTFQLNSNGDYTYIVNNTNATVQGLRTSGQTLTDQFTYTVSDGTNTSNLTTVTISIHGQNDNPVANADNPIVVNEAGGTNNGTPGNNINAAFGYNVITGNGAGNVADTDVDATANGETLTVVGVLDGNHLADLTPPTGNVGPNSFTFGPSISANPPNDYGSLAMQTDGDYMFTVNNNNATVQGLNTGQHVDAIYTYTLQDTAGAQSVALITVAINGANDAPVAQADGAYVANKDFQLTVNAAQGVLANDSDVDNASITAVLNVGPSHSSAFNLAADGSFTYTAAAGYLGADSFTYHASDGSLSSSIVTVTLDVQPLVWHVDNNHGPDAIEDGSAAHPFQSIANFNTANAGAAHKPDVVYLHYGTGTYNEADGFNLSNNQTLLGQGVDLTYDTSASAPGGVQTIVVQDNDNTFIPTIQTSAGDGIDLALNNTVRGLIVGDTSGFDISNTGAGSVGNLTISNVTLNGSGGIINIANGGTLDVTLDAASTSAAGTKGIFLNDVDNSSFTVSGTTIINDATTDGINITNSQNSTFAFGQKVTILNDGGANGDGVDLQTNNATDSTFNFNGGVDITVNGTDAFGFRATSSGTVNILNPGSDNQITSNNGTAIFINPTAFQANLTNVTAGDTATGDGIHLEGVTGTGVTIGNASINGVGGDGVEINGGTANITIGGSIGNTDDPAGIGVLVTGGTGNVTINATINDASASNAVVSVANRASGTVDFNGAITSTGTGVSLTGNTGGAVNFDGGMNLSTGTNAAFTVGGGSTAATLNVTGSNTLTTSTGQIVNLDAVSIGASGASFGSLQATGTTIGSAVVFNAVDGTNNTVSTSGISIAGVSGGGADGVRISGGSDATFSFGGTTTINTTADDGISISGGGGPVSFNNVVLNNMGGDGVEINGATAAVTLSTGMIGNTDDPAGRGVVITGGSGDVSVGASITKTTAGDIVEMTGRTAGTVTLSGNLSATGGVANGIDVNTNTGGTLNFTGQTQTLTTGGNTAVNLATNTGATINFNPTAGGNGLDISTAGGTGFNATGGGTVNVLGTGNTVNSTSATAINFDNTNIGANDLNFVSVSAGNAGAGTADVGISLVSTGTAGGLHVTGNGTNIGATGGGVIQRMTGADGSITSGVGIYLNNTSEVSLNGMLLQNFDNLGIFGQSVNGIKLTNSTIGGTIGTSSGSNDAAIAFGTTIPGGTNGFANNSTSLFDNVNISGGIEHNVEIHQQSGTFHLTISNSNIHDNSVALGSDGLLIETAGTAHGIIKVNNTTFDDNKSQAVQANALETSFLELTLHDNDILSTTQGNEGFILQNAASGDLTVAVTNNTFTGINGTNILVGNVVNNATAASELNATVSGNIMTLDGPAVNRTLIAFFSSTIGQQSTSKVLIDGNTINTIADPVNGLAESLFVSTPDANTDPLVYVTVSNNVVNIDDDNGLALRGIAVQSTQDVSTMHADVRGNDVNYLDGAPVGVNGIRVRQVAPATLDLEPGVGGANAAAVLAANNPLSTTEIVGTVTVSANNNTALLPSNPTTPTLPSFLLAAAGGVASASGATGDHDLTLAELAGTIEAAIGRWVAAGLTADGLAALDHLRFVVGDLGGSNLGLTLPDLILIDDDAAGHGWFIDASPFDDSEFGHALTATQLRTDPLGAPAGQMDLLTVVMHEIGHALGLDHDLNGDSLMSEQLVTGERRVSGADAAATGPLQVSPQPDLTGPVLVSPEPVQPAAAPFIGNDIVRGFDAEYYLAQYADVAAAGIDPLLHFELYGWQEGRNPNAFFDTAGYFEHYADVAAAGINPLTHYDMYGWAEGRDPSASFDTAGYLATYADVAAAHVDPLDHFLRHGVHEGRSSVNDGLWGT